MTFLESIVLGLVQGMTEFLPVSSSGHLIIAREFLHMPLEGSLSFDVFLNTATLLAVIVCFWGDIKALIVDFLSEGFSSRSRNLIFAIITGSIPAGFFGFLYGDQIEGYFRAPAMVAWALIGGSILMFAADRLSKNEGGVNPLKGFFVGFFQSLALIPGVSRSGSSISGGLLCGLSREEAIKFSFLLLIPVSFGALLKVVLDMGSAGASNFFDLLHITAFLTAFISGLWSIRFLVRYLKTHSFTPFIIYRIVLALVILLFI